MSVGTKIKALRLQRGMTQGVLADGIVTRGMLSRIENGSANPSMASLSALAERLDVSPSFLLEAGDDLLPAERAHFEKKLAAAYRATDARGCLALFSASPFAEDEAFVGIYTHTAFSVAVEDFCRGDFTAARALLSTVERLLPRSLLPIPDISADRISFMRSVMDNIGATDMSLFAIGDAPDFAFQPALFFYILRLLQNGQHDTCGFFLEFGNLSPMYRTYIEAQLYIRDYKLIDAILAMKGLVAKKECPCFLTLLCYASMETCCKICEDFKGAYENHLAFQAFLEKIQNKE